MSLDAVLQRCLEVRGITSACVVSPDGTLIAGAEGVTGDLMRVAELVPSALGSSRVLGGLMGDGEITHALVEFDDAPVLLVPLPTEYSVDGGPVVVLTLANVADLGRVRFRLKAVLPELASALADSGSTATASSAPRGG